MDVICDHPDWWVLLSLNGFGLHVKVLDTHRIFAESNISVFKEEIDKLHVNQSYNHQVSKGDKLYMHSSLDAVGSDINNNMDQWYLILIAVRVQNQINKEARINSFKRFNMHPHTRVLFDEWMRKLDKRVFLTSEKHLRQELHCIMLCRNVLNYLLSRNGIKSLARLTKFTGTCHQMKRCGQNIIFFVLLSLPVLKTFSS